MDDKDHIEGNLFVIRVGHKNIGLISMDDAMKIEFMAEKYDFDEVRSDSQ